MSIMCNQASVIRLATLVAALVLTTATASADDEDENPFDKPRTTLGFGFLAGSYRVGPVAGPGIGLHVDLGRQMGPLLVYGEYNMLSVGESSMQVDDPLRGFLHRLGLNARYNLIQFGGGTRFPVQGAFWLEAGIGRQIVRWNEGGRLTRDDLGLGFGVQSDFRLNRDRPNSRYLGFYYAFRTTISEAPVDPMAPMTCDGPCDEPTGPAPYDLSLLFNVGVSFGR